MQVFRTDNNMGSYCATRLERLIPGDSYDICGLYRSFLRAMSIGLLPEQYLTDGFDWKKIYSEILRLMSIRDVAFEIKLQEMRYVAMKHGEEFLKWFDETTQTWGQNHIFIDENRANAQSDRRLYECGTTRAGGVTLDASEHGVTNIYEAVKLFEKLTGL
jgi:hypothetical protein